MPLFRRWILSVIGLSFGLALAGCGSFDPTDWFHNEKPLPGERKLVFPEGVPGVPQGVPSELVKGNQPATVPSAVAAVENTPPAETKPAPAAKPKPNVAARPKPRAKPKEIAAPAPAPSKQPPTEVTVEPRTPQTPRPAAQPAAQQSTAKSSVWGPSPGQAKGAAAPWPAPSTQPRTPAPWPEAPAPGTFSR